MFVKMSIDPNGPGCNVYVSNVVESFVAAKNIFKIHIFTGLDWWNQR